jgi:hypothetical protein
MEASSRPAIVGTSKDVEDPAGQIHYAEAMFKALMRGSRINKPGQGELMDVPETLKGSGVDDFPFIGAENDERMDRITKFVVLLSHTTMVATAEEWP